MFEKAEKIAVFLTVIAILLMTFEVGFGGVLLNLSLGTLSLLYFYSGLAYRKSTPKFLKKMALDENGNSSLVPNVVFGYAWSAGVIGILFVSQGFPGSDVMLNVALIGAIVGVGFSYFKYRDKTMEKLRPYFFRILLITGIVGLFAVTPKKQIREFLHINSIELPMEE